VDLVGYNYYYYYTCLIASCWTTWVSQYQKGKTSLDLNEARNGGFGDAVASAGPCADSLHLPPARQITKHSTPSLNFYRPDALLGAQPTV